MISHPFQPSEVGGECGFDLRGVFPCQRVLDRQDALGPLGGIIG
jgi:hypothetical protein